MGKKIFFEFSLISNPGIPEYRDFVFCLRIPTREAVEKQPIITMWLLKSNLQYSRKVYGHVKMRYMKTDGAIGQFLLFQVFVVIGGFKILNYYLAGCMLTLIYQNYSQSVGFEPTLPEGI